LKLVKGDAAFPVRFLKEDDRAKYLRDRTKKLCQAGVRRGFDALPFGQPVDFARTGRPGFGSISNVIREQVKAQKVYSIAVICLPNGAIGMDVIEIQFDATIPDHDPAYLKMMSDTLAKTWQHRSPGTAHHQLARDRQIRTEETRRAMPFNFADW
jgi:hypothetical protein